MRAIQIKQKRKCFLVGLFIYLFIYFFGLLSFLAHDLPHFIQETLTHYFPNWAKSLIKTKVTSDCQHKPFVPPALQLQAVKKLQSKVFHLYTCIYMSCTSAQVSAVFQRSFLCCARLEIQSAIVSLMLCGPTWRSSSSIQPIECTGKLRTWRKKKKSSSKETVTK